MKTINAYILLLCFICSFHLLSIPLHAQQKMDVNGYSINYTIKGNGPYLFVGHPTAGKIGYELSLTALEKSFTVVYYDHRGTGKSQVPNNLNDYHLDSLVEELNSIRKNLNIDKIWIFGHSDQSAIALVFALKFPSNTNGLILSGTSLVGTMEESMDRRKIAENKRAKESNWFQQVLNDWDYSIAHQTSSNLQGDDVTYASIKWWCYDESSAQKVIPIVKQININGRRKKVNHQSYTESPEERLVYLNYQKEFYKIAVPVLIVNGIADTNNQPAFALQLQQTLVNAKLVLINKAGHFPWIENSSETFESISSWLKRVTN